MIYKWQKSQKPLIMSELKKMPIWQSRLLGATRKLKILRSVAHSERHPRNFMSFWGSPDFPNVGHGHRCYVAGIGKTKAQSNDRALFSFRLLPVAGFPSPAT